MSKTVEAHVLKDFTLVRQMGSGAYGHVWEVKQKRNGHKYALKKVFDAFRNSIDAQRTYREVQVLHQIQHNNIVKLYRVIRSKNNKDLYLLFEFMEADLHSVVGTNILEKMHQIYIFYQILKGIYYVHSAQLIHRDLKPSNVLINSQCNTKLCDFGLVRSIVSDHSDSQQIVLSEQVATKWYRAPQLLLGSRTYGKAVDMWSYGCIITEVLTGKPMFAGSSTLNQFEKILQYTGIPPKSDIQSLQSPIAEQLLDQIKIKKKSFRDYFQNVDSAFFQLIEGCLQLNPQRRITVQEALRLKLFEEFQDQPLKTANRPIIPKINDNMRLTTKAYRQKIYQDIELRYQPKIFRDKINDYRNYNSLQNRKISSDSSHQNYSNNYKKRSQSKKRVCSANKVSYNDKIYGKTLQKYKSSHNSGFMAPRKVSQNKNSKNLIKASPYFKSNNSLKTHQVSEHLASISSVSSNLKNKSVSKTQQKKFEHKYPKYQQNKFNSPKSQTNNKTNSVVHQVSHVKSVKTIKKGSKTKVYEAQKKDILKSIGVQRGKKLIKYIK